MNSLFIGLGGAGTHAVAELQKKFKEYDRTVKNPSKNNYLYIDTDSAVQNTYPFIAKDDQSHFFSLSSETTPKTIITKHFHAVNARNPWSVRLKEWVDSDNTLVNSNQKLTNGASGVRMKSRIALFECYNNLRNTLLSKMSIDGETVERIYVISGTCGGTGCGSVLDILFMIQEIKKQHVNTKFPNVQLMLVMPEGYICGFESNDHRHTDYKLNAYALFAEMNAVLKDAWDNSVPRTDEYGRYLNKKSKIVENPNDAQKVLAGVAGLQFAKFSAVPITSGVANPMNFDPFSNAYLFDSYNSNTQKAYDYKQVSDFISNFIFNFEVEQSINGTFESDFSNVLESGKAYSASSYYIDAFSATGSFTVQTHEELLKNYVQDKFIFQMMTYGFVGVQDDSKVDATPITKKDGILSIINEKITQFVDNLWLKLETLDSAPSKDNLKSVLKRYYENANNAKPNYDKIFEDWGVGTNPNREFNQMCVQLNDAVNDACKDWIVEFNLRHAKKLSAELDLMQTTKHNKLAKLIEDKSKEMFIRSESLKKAVKETLKTYTELLVCKYLAIDGILDQYGGEIDTFIANLKFDTYELRDGVNLNGWYAAYIKRLTELEADTSRKFIPAISTILNGTKLSDKSGFDDKYAQLVRQDSSMPDMTPFDSAVAPNSIKDLLYTRKHAIMQSIVTRDQNFTSLFRPDSLNSNDNKNAILETFRKETDHYAYEMVEANGSLKIELKNQMNSEEIRDEVAQALYAYEDVIFSDNVVDQSSNKPLKIMYVGNFNDNAIILKKINSINVEKSNMEMTFAPDTNSYWHDRIVKIIVKTNYSIDEYSFFDGYKEEFGVSYQKNSSEVTFHQPFLDKRFWECEDANIVQLFKDESQKTTEELKGIERENAAALAAENLRKQKESLGWSDENKQILAFSFTSLLLCEYFKKMKTLSNTKDFFVKFKVRKTAKTTTVPVGYDEDTKKLTLTMSDNYKMDPNASKFDITSVWSKKLTAIDSSEIQETGNEYVAYWIRIIQSKLTDVSLPSTAVDKIFQKSYGYLTELKSREISAEDIREFATTYYDVTSRERTERDIFEDFLLWFNER